jgi:hypothetical protein
MADQYRRVILALIRNNGPMTAEQLMMALNDRHMGLTPAVLSAWLTAYRDAGMLSVADDPDHPHDQWHAKWCLVTHAVLCWDKPPKAEAYEEWAKRQSDDTPPGTYAPNMAGEWMTRWKAKLAGQRSGQLRVEVRKSLGVRHAGSVQVLVIAYENGIVAMSMNGTAEFTEGEFREMSAAVDEARQVMHDYRAAHPREETVAL